MGPGVSRRVDKGPKGSFRDVGRDTGPDFRFDLESECLRINFLWRDDVWSVETQIPPDTLSGARDRQSSTPKFRDESRVNNTRSSSRDPKTLEVVGVQISVSHVRRSCSTNTSTLCYYTTTTTSTFHGVFTYLMKAIRTHTRVHTSIPTSWRPLSTPPM